MAAPVVRPRVRPDELISKILPCIELTSHVDSRGESVKRAREDIFQEKLATDNIGLLLGPRGSGKTSLLFQCALNQAARGLRVTYIMQTKLNSLPLPVKTSDGATSVLPDHSHMKQIQMLYLCDRPSLIKYLAGLHLRPNSPHVLVVDNLEAYFQPCAGEDVLAAVSQVLSLLIDSFTFLVNKVPQGKASECFLFASAVENSSLCSTYQLFFPLLMTLEGVSGKDKTYQLCPSIHQKTLGRVTVLKITDAAIICVL